MTKNSMLETPQISVETADLARSVVDELVARYQARDDTHPVG